MWKNHVKNLLGLMEFEGIGQGHLLGSGEVLSNQGFSEGLG